MREFTFREPKIPWVGHIERIHQLPMSEQEESGAFKCCACDQCNQLRVEKGTKPMQWVKRVEHWYSPDGVMELVYWSIVAKVST